MLWVHRHLAFTVAKGLEALLQLVHTVQGLHDFSVPHGNLKADNALVDKADPLNVVLADFGHACDIAADGTIPDLSGPRQVSHATHLPWKLCMGPLHWVYGSFPASESMLHACGQLPHRPVLLTCIDNEMFLCPGWCFSTCMVSDKVYWEHPLAPCLCLTMSCAWG
jgi:serine/threonine protein kinase